MVPAKVNVVKSERLGRIGRLFVLGVECAFLLVELGDRPPLPRQGTAIREMRTDAH